MEFGKRGDQARRFLEPGLVIDTDWIYGDRVGYFWRQERSLTHIETLMSWSMRFGNRRVAYQNLILKPTLYFLTSDMYSYCITCFTSQSLEMFTFLCLSTCTPLLQPLPSSHSSSRPRGASQTARIPPLLSATQACYAQTTPIPASGHPPARPRRHLESRP